MELFKKKDKKEENGDVVPRFPDIPKLPELPEFESLDEEPEEKISQLPSFPQSSIGNRFSQYSIKNAVTGEKEDEREEEVDEPADIYGQMIQPSLSKPEPARAYEPTKIVSSSKGDEPRFIRIDKFEESEKAFNDIKKQAAEIEKLFGDLKKVKEEEEKEMNIFEGEIRKIKEKIESIDKNMFYEKE
jgi:hypothetical protein